jgi:hypothetical protein
VLLILALAIALPVGVLGSIHWLEAEGVWPKLRADAPKWVPSAEVRATTRDGTLVKLRVAFDAGDNTTKDIVERQLREMGLVLELSVSSLSTRELAARDGIARLSQDMLARTNDYLAAQGVAPLRSVAIQDLWYTRP